MSEFSTLTTKHVTPLLRQRGFKKHGSFGRGSLHDSAHYRRGDLELVLTYSLHPYDYPDVGIRLRVRDGNGSRFDRLHRPAEGGVEAMIRGVLEDIQSGASGA